jgi:pyridoxine 4-dehydrogenase
MVAGKSVSRLGFGTMRLLPNSTWGNTPEPRVVRNLLAAAVHEHGITHIDTADAYGPHSVELLVAQALYPYPPELLIATKVGLIRPRPEQWVPLGRPAYLRAAVEQSLRRLRTDRLDLCYLHRIDPLVPLADQVATLAELADEGKIAAIGLSKVTPEQIAHAQNVAPIAAVSNCLNINEPDDPALEYCRNNDIAYVPFRPLALGALPPAKALEFLFGLGPHIAPVPATGNPEHLRELVAAAESWEAEPWG